MRSSIVSRVLGILFIAVIVGALIGWWAGRNPSRRMTIAPEKPTPRLSTRTEPEPISILPETNVMAVAPTPTATNANIPEEPETWETKLNEILLSDTEPNKKGEDLLELMPTVNEEAQVELAGHIVNLLDDEHFSSATKYLTNAEMPEAVSSVFMTDLYNRGNTLKLPLVLAVARNEKHPLQGEAKDLLELYIEEDHGTDWNAWETSMNAWLKEHPE